MVFELKGARVRMGYDLAKAGKLLGITKQGYLKKEKSGKFSDAEKLILINAFGLTYDQFNEIFYGGGLPWKN